MSTWEPCEQRGLIASISNCKCHLRPRQMWFIICCRRVNASMESWDRWASLWAGAPHWSYDSCGTGGWLQPEAGATALEICCHFAKNSVFCLDIVYEVTREIPRKKCIKPSGEVSWKSCCCMFVVVDNLRASPELFSFASDASPSAAGACGAPMDQQDRLQLCDETEERGNQVRLNCIEPPPPVLRDARGATAALMIRKYWLTLFSYRFPAPKHSNL